MLKENAQKLPQELSFDRSIKWTWSLRKLQKERYNIVSPKPNYSPSAGDVVVAEVVKIGNHSRIYSSENKYTRLYKGDIIVGTMGFRYATDAFHADKLDLNKLHLLTNSGLLGTVTSRHSKTSDPTHVRVIGRIRPNGQLEPLNLKQLQFQHSIAHSEYPPVVFVVGTGMNSGKTTSTARIGKALVNSYLSVAILKVTGSVANRDLFEFEAVDAQYTSDFSDYGFPSTYLCAAQEIEALFFQMIEDTLYTKPDIILVEIADGILQRETQMLLKSKVVKATAAGLILTAPCALSALSLVDVARKLGHCPIAVTGIITNAPLFVAEFQELENTPIFDTQGEVNKIRDLIVAKITTPVPKATVQA